MTTEDVSQEPLVRPALVELMMEVYETDSIEAMQAVDREDIRATLENGVLRVETYPEEGA